MGDTLEHKITRVTLIGIWINLILVILKLFFGYWGQSDALVADGYHSLSDFVTDFIVIYCTSIAYKKADKEHPYGHGKYETISTVAIGLILMLIGIYIAYDGVSVIYGAVKGKIIPKPSVWTIIIACISIASKEYCYRFTIKKGKALNSTILIANAWHHRSDAFSSIATLIGVSISYCMGEVWRIMDPITSIVIAIFIIVAAFGIMKPSVKELLEVGLPEKEKREIEEIIESIEGVKYLHNLRTRKNGNSKIIDVNIHVPADMSVKCAHNISNEIESKIRDHYVGTHIIIYIHIEPDE